MHIQNVLTLISVECPDLLHETLRVELVGSTFHQNDNTFAGHRVCCYYDDNGEEVSAYRVTYPCLWPNVDYDGRYDYTNRHNAVAHDMEHCRVNINVATHQFSLSFSNFFGLFTLLRNNTFSFLRGFTYFFWVMAAILWVMRMLVLDNRSARNIVCFVALMLMLGAFCATVIVVALATMFVIMTMVVMLLIAVIIMVMTFVIMTVTFVVVVATFVTFVAVAMTIVVVAMTIVAVFVTIVAVFVTFVAVAMTFVVVSVTVSMVMIMSAATVIIAAQMVVSVPRMQNFDLDQIKDETNDRNN